MRSVPERPASEHVAGGHHRAKNSECVAVGRSGSPAAITDRHYGHSGDRDHDSCCGPCRDAFVENHGGADSHEQGL